MLLAARNTKASYALIVNLWYQLKSMKVKDLPETTDLGDVLIELPDEALAAFEDYLGGEKKMYLVGEMMNEFWMSPNPPKPNGKGNRRLYALPMGYQPSDILEWEVASQM